MQPKSPIEKHCVVCGSKFATLYRHKKICSEPCAHRKKRQKLREQGRCAECRRFRLNGEPCVCSGIRKKDPKVREACRLRDVRLRLEAKIEAFTRYGGCSCACCGEKHIEFLEIDHIQNDGAEHRMRLGGKNFVGLRFYKWLKRNAYPDGFQVLCGNCNSAKGRYGECPHERERREAGNVSIGHPYGSAASQT